MMKTIIIIVLIITIIISKYYKRLGEEKYDNLFNHYYTVEYKREYTMEDREKRLGPCKSNNNSIEHRDTFRTCGGVKMIGTAHTNE